MKLRVTHHTQSAEAKESATSGNHEIKLNFAPNLGNGPFSAQSHAFLLRVANSQSLLPIPRSSAILPP